MASEVGTAYVTLIPSAKGFATKMQSELGGDLTRAGQQGGTQYGTQFSGGASKTIGGRARSIFSGLAKGGALAAAAAGVAAGKVLGDSIAAASDLGETLSKTNQIFGNIEGDKLARWSEDLATQLGQSQQQALDAASTFGVFGKSAGLTGGDLRGFSQQFTVLASDLASFHNTSPQEAIDALGAALRGESEPMRRYGVLLDDASLRQEALHQGLVKTTKQALTPQQKVLAAQALILKQTGDAQGDFQRTSGGLANQQRILSAQWANAKVQIGKGLLPVALKLVTWANDLLPRLGDLASVVKAQLGPAVAWVRDQFARFTGALGDGDSKVSKFRAAAAAGFAAVRQAMDEVVTFVRDKVIPGVLRIADAYRGLAKVVLPIVRQLVDVVISKWGEIEPQVRAIWESVKSTITDAMTIIERVVRIATALLSWVWKNFGDNIKKYLGTALSAVVQILRGAFQIVAGIFKTVSSLLKGDWKGVWEGIKQILRGAWNVLVGIVRQGWNVITFAFKNAGVLLRKVLSKAWDGLKALVRLGIQALVAYVRNLPHMWLSVLSGIGHLLSSLFSRAWSLAKTAVSHGIDTIVEGVRALPGRLLDLGPKMLSAGKTIIGKFVDGMKNAAGIISGIAGNVWDALRGLINGAIDKLNSALEFTIGIPGPDIHVDVGNIGHLATGGRATRATLAVIGEGREPESVLPDSVLRGLLQRAHDSGNGRVGLLTITNWQDGTGYFRLVADSAVEGDARFRRNLEGMNA